MEGAGGSGPPTPTNAAPALGRRTAHGFAWMLGQTLLSKGAGMVGQIMVAWFLTPHDFKLVALVYAVVVFPALIRDSGLQGILVQRQHHLRRWIQPAFWMSLMLGGVATVLMLAAAPLAARFYGQPKLVGLISVVAVGGMLNALTTVPSAMVQIHMRFRFQAAWSLVSNLMMQAITIVLAWRGFGAYSFVLANAFCSLATTAAMWYAEPFKVHSRLYLRRWRYMVGDSGTLLLNYLLWAVVAQGDYLCLAAFHKTDDSTGMFYFAFNLSWQSVLLLTLNVGAVLYPAIARLRNDPARQMQAYLRTLRVLALVSVPACWLQAVVASPGIHLLFKSKWYPAIPATQALCVGMAVRCVGSTVAAITLGRGRNLLQLTFSAVYAVLFIGTMLLASSCGEAVLRALHVPAASPQLAVAIAEGGFYMIIDPITLAYVLRIYGEPGIAHLTRIFGVPLGAGLAAAGAAWAAQAAVPEFRGTSLTRILAGTVAMVAVYVPLILVFARGTVQDLLQMRKGNNAAAA